MKKLLVTIIFSVNLILQWENGDLKLCFGQKTFAQPNVQEIAQYLNSLNNGYTYTYSFSANLVYQHSGMGGWPAIIHPNTISIPGTWTWNGPATGLGFSNWVSNLSAPFSSALNSFLSSMGPGYGGEAGGGVEFDGWMPMPDGFGYDPTDPGSVDWLMNDPYFNPGYLDPWGQDVYENLNMYYTLYTGNISYDCANQVFGTAYTDSCGRCVGGSTGLTPCVKDCDSVWGGGRYIDSCGICVDSIRKQPCDTFYKKIGDSINNYINRPEFVDSLNKFKRNTAADTLEKAISLGIDLSSGAYKTTDIRIAPPGNMVHLIHNYPGMRVETMLHFHTKSAYPCYSAGDFYSLQTVFAHPYYFHLKSHYVFGAADSSLFGMVIEDSLLYDNFINNFPVATTMDPATNGWDTSKPMGLDFKAVYDYLNIIVGLNANDSYTQAMAYVMSKYNSGLVMYRRRKGENNFKKINTKETTNPVTGLKTYSDANCL